MNVVDNSNITVEELLNEMADLEIVSGEDFLERKVTVSDLSRPALELTGYFDFYSKERIQLLGATEITFISRMTPAEKTIIFKRLCHPETPAFLISRGLKVPEELIKMATRKEIPVLRSHRRTTRVSAVIGNYLEERLAERMSQHGVLVDIYGMGVLIIGESGIGKSETALELIERGHRLVADDRVELHMMDETRIIGEAPEILRNLMEIRGVGVIDVASIFGVGGVRETKTINLVINLKHWNENDAYDRLGNNVGSMKFFNVEIPMLTIPVRVGRNLATISEVAALNMRAKQMGYDATEQFETNLTNLIQQNTEDYRENDV